MTKEETRHNEELDFNIRKADEDYEKYLADLAEQKAAYVKNNPHNPYINSMFLPVLGKKFIGGIRYVD